ncbi:MAG: nitroreductase family protein [Acholeplasmataceae bacterium]|nr:nitroreductase family protein [Acholeplasmataceae bacterium]
MDHFHQLIQKRESCRQFNGRAVEKEKIDTCLKAARLAPSACNGQPWHFYVVTHEEHIQKQAKNMQAFNSKAGAFIVVVEEKTSITSRIGSKLKNNDFSQIDIGIVTAYITLQATELGLSSCIIGWFDEMKTKTLLDIPKNKRIRIIISLGYTDEEELRKKQRKSMEETTTYL